MSAVRGSGAQYQPTTPGSVDDRVLHVLRTHGPMTAEEIAEALGQDRFPVRYALERLRGRGLVRVAGMAARDASQWGEGGPVGIWEATPTE